VYAAAVALVAGVVLVLTGNVPGQDGAAPVPSRPSTDTPAQTAVSRQDVAAARKQYAGLGVAERLRDSTYRRDEFGHGWASVPDCDTRDQILARDLEAVTYGKGCNVTGGTLDDPYSGQTVTFDKTNPAAVQIDHVVSLSMAWTLGANRWTYQRRFNFANDPANLLAVDGPTNQSKGDREGWKPPNRGAWCMYAVRAVTVSHRYRLPVTPTDHKALGQMLAACPTAGR